MAEFKLKGFFDLSDNVFVGKSVSAILKSSASRDALVTLFGRDNMPASVMRAKKATPTNDSDEIVHNGRGYTDTHIKTKYKKGSTLNKSFAVSGSGTKKGALSTFPQNVGRTVLLLYTEPGMLVVDPFAGHNSRMELCITNGRHYEGCDLSTTFMEFNKRRADHLRSIFKKSKLTLHHCDSRKMPVKDGVGDFTITSPPYYDIEEYGDEPAQLGKSKTYAKFLDGIGDVLKENYRCLKPGAYAVWFVNDFKRRGIFHAYHLDLCTLAMAAGFKMHDIFIVDFGSCMGSIFINQYIEHKLIPKQHEYGLVFQKPIQ